MGKDPGRGPRSCASSDRRLRRHSRRSARSREASTRRSSPIGVSSRRFGQLRGGYQSRRRSTAKASAAMPRSRERGLLLLPRSDQNAMKHAGGASTVSITLVDDGDLRFAVRDDGRVRRRRRQVGSRTDEHARSSCGRRRGADDRIGTGKGHPRPRRDFSALIRLGRPRDFGPAGHMRADPSCLCRRQPDRQRGSEQMLTGETEIEVVASCVDLP